MKKPLGSIVWTDLTVPNATSLTTFYEKVVGWNTQPLSQGNYDDYVMTTNVEGGATGICHARGNNSNVPPQWMIYISVEDIAQSIEACKSAGGQVLDGPRKVSGEDFAVIQDPAGAVFAIITDSGQ